MRNAVQVDVENVLAYLDDKERTDEQIMRACHLSGNRWRQVRGLLLASGQIWTVQTKPKSYMRVFASLDNE